MATDDPYDPTYHGAMSMYFGTRHVRYTMVDPLKRELSEGKLLRADLASELPALLGQTNLDQITRVSLEADDARTIMALHDLYMLRDPPPHAPPFWYQADHHAPATQYRGPALVLAHARKTPDRAVSCRLDLEMMGFLFFFEEPTPAPHDLRLARMMAPAKEAGRKMVEAIEKTTEAAGGKWPGYFKIEVEARTLIGTLEVLAHHLDDERRGGELTMHDHAMLRFFSASYTELVENGYLDPDMCSPTLARWIDVFGE